MEMWELVKKVTDKGYVLSVGPCWKEDYVEIRLSDVHSPRRMMMLVELKRGVAEGIVYYNPNRAIENAIDYLFHKSEKEVGQ